MLGLEIYIRIRTRGSLALIKISQLRVYDYNKKIRS